MAIANKVISVDAFEAKRKFSQLLEYVKDGAEIVIFKHQKPIAKLVSFQKPSRVELSGLFKRRTIFGPRIP